MCRRPTGLQELLWSLQTNQVVSVISVTPSAPVGDERSNQAVIFQKIELFVATIVRTSNPTLFS
jgi:hypothetical protein